MPRGDPPMEDGVRNRATSVDGVTWCGRFRCSELKLRSGVMPRQQRHGPDASPSPLAGEGLGRGGKGSRRLAFPVSQLFHRLGSPSRRRPPATLPAPHIAPQRRRQEQPLANAWSDRNDGFVLSGRATSPFPPGRA
jgi:hypothetical protein